jgi:Leucine-rich repeat (LRR) protein
MSMNHTIPIESEEASASLSTSDLSGSVNNTAFTTDDDKMEDVEVGGNDAPEEPGMTQGNTLVDVPGTMNKGIRAGSIRRWVYVTAILLIVLAVVIGIAASVSNNNNNKTSASSGSVPNSSPVSSPVLSPVASPTAASPVATNPTAPTAAARQANYEQIVTFLSARGVSNEDDLRRRGSHQHDSAVFLANHDPLNLPLPSGTDLSDPQVEHYVTRYVLTLLHHGWDGYNWTFQLNFMSELEMCYWNGMKATFQPSFVPLAEAGGVFCLNGTQTPVALDLGESVVAFLYRMKRILIIRVLTVSRSLFFSFPEYNKLKGTIPTELGLLTKLVFLDLEFNEINGTIPTELCQLTDLEHLSLRANLLTGSLPSCMGQWSKLAYLDLEVNQLDGSFPQGDALCNMKELDTVVLQRNLFSGALPTCMGQWTRLNGFFASENFFTGSLPSELALLPNVSHFLVDDNELTGNPNTVFSDMPTLKFLYLDNNQFTGVIDSTFVANSPNLTALDISHNNFTLDPAAPVFPLHLLQHPTLQILDASTNLLNGSLPSTELQANNALLFLSLHANALRGSIPRQLHQFSELAHLDLSLNSFTGALPDQLFSLRLLNLFLSENPNLQSGLLPDSILTNHTGFRELSLRNTQRTGPLPTLVGFSDLVLLDLGGNDFTGAIPTQYSELPNLRYLLLNGNPDLSGSIPVMSQSPALQIALLDNTNIYGDFSSLCALTAFTDLDASDVLGDSALIVNCNTTAGTVSNCACCKCCHRPGGCSNPVVASLDWTWEQRMSQTVRDFAVNDTLLLDFEQL